MSKIAGRARGLASAPDMAIFVIQANSGTKSLRRQVLGLTQIEARRVAADFGDSWSGRASASKDFAQIVKPGLRRDHQSNPGPIFKLANNLKPPRAKTRSEIARAMGDRHVVENDIARCRLGERLGDDEHGHTGRMIRALDEGQPSDDLGRFRLDE